MRWSAPAVVALVTTAAGCPAPAPPPGGREAVSELAVVLEAAADGHAWALRELGSAYYYSERGRPHDRAEAVRWMQSAARRGVADAQFDLAVAYADGVGLGRDERLAALWWTRAAAQGDVRAQLHLGLLDADDHDAFAE
ncbi:MAG: hypothetical protein OXF93_19430 [Acidobacteria bacterium]|nr:hypothetical protein [Acidobacteriota bacterium]